MGDVLVHAPTENFENQFYLASSTGNSSRTIVLRQTGRKGLRTRRQKKEGPENRGNEILLLEAKLEHAW